MSQPRQFSLLIATKPVWVTEPTLEVALRGAALTRVLVATDALTYTLQTGSLPTGVTLSASGDLSGTPTVAGTYVFTVRAVGESSAVFTNRTFTVLVAPQPSWVTGSALSDIQASEAVSVQLTAADASTYQLMSGALPTGMVIGPTGLISGSTSATGNYTFTVRAISVYPAFLTDKTFTLIVRSPPVWSTAAGLADNAVGVALSLQLQASLSPTYAVTAGAVPVGTSLSSQGVLSGTPTAPGLYTFTVRASNAPGYGADRVFTLLVVDTPVWVTSATLSDVLVSSAVSVQLTATGATGYAAVTALPSGLSLSGSGLLSGTPSATGSTSFQVRATTASASVSTLRTFTLLITKQPVFTTAATLPNAFKTSAASTLIAATDAVSYAVTSGTLPTGTSLSSAGQLSGTFTDAGSFAFGVRATGTSASAFADRNFTQLVVTQPVWQTPSSLTELLRDRPATFQLDATYASDYTLTFGVVPGVSVSSAGLLSGTPTVAGSTPITIRAGTLNPGVYTDKNFTAVVALTPVWTTTSPLTSAGQSIAYTQTFVTDIGVNYSLKSGALPAGLTLASNGTLSGTPTTPGSYSFEIRAATASATNYTDKAFTLDVTDLPVWSTASSLTDVPALAAYSLTLVATNAGSYAVQAGTLPNGLSLNTSTGVISGTPTVSGTYAFTIRATRTGAPGVFADRAFTQVVATTPTWVTSGSLSNTARNVAYSLTLSATNASTTGFSVTTGTLPAGVSLSASGTLSGTPTALATYSFTIRALATNSSTVFADRAFTLTTVPLPVWTTTTLVDAPAGTVYSVQLVAANAVTFALKTGTLPTGLSLSTGGLLSGTPSAAGSFSFTVTATGNASNAVTDQALTQLIATTPTWVTGASLANTARNVAYSLTLSATNANATGFSVTAGTLPAGLSLSSSGILSGTPTGLATYNFTVRATSTTSTTVFAERGFTITTVALPVWTTTTLVDVAANVAYSVQLVAANAVSFALKTGTLPTGLTLSPGGLLSGTPTVLGSYGFTVTATGDATNALTDQALTQVVATTPTWTTGASLANTAQSVAYSFTLVATNANATGYSVTTGTLPAGVTLSTAGVLSGTPTAAATYNFTVRALSTTSAVVFADRAFSITTVPLPVWTSPAAGALTDLPAGVAIATLNFVATNGITYAVTAGSLPTGLSLSSGGTLTGTPTAGSYSFTVTATGNATNATAARAFTQIVATTPTWSTSAALTSTAQSVAYSFTLVATNANPAGYSVTTGTLPAGVTLSTAGVLSGTPTAAATYNFTVRALSTTSSAVFADRAFSLTTVPLPVWTSPAAGALTDMPTGSAITTLNFVATNGVSYAVTVGSLPTGLSLSSGGALTGTPTAAGSFSFTVTATGDATNATATRAFTQIVAATPVWTTAASLTDLTDTTAVSFQFAATNAVSYAVTTGSLPPGLSLSSGGLLTGTTGSTLASYSFTIRATGSSAVAFADRAFTQNVVANLFLNSVKYRGLIAGSGFTMVLGTDGNVYGCGDNTGGNITGVVGTNSSSFVQVPGLSNIVRLSEGLHASYTIYCQNSSGVWYSWGRKSQGSNGDGTTNTVALPASQWTYVANVTRMVVSQTCTFALTASGQWYCWGQNNNGELGKGNANVFSSPVTFTALSNIKDVSAGDYGYLFLLNDGSVYATGFTDATSGIVTAPTLIMSGGSRIFGGGDSGSHVLKTDGTWWSWGNNNSGNLGLGNSTNVPRSAPVRNTYLESLGTIRQITNSEKTTLVTTSTGAAYAMGNKLQFAVGTTETGNFTLSIPSAYACSAAPSNGHSAWVTSSVQLYTGGSGATATGSGTANINPTLLTTTFTLAAVAVTPTWNTPAAFTVSGAFNKRLDASDAGTYYLQSGSLPGGVTLSNDGLLSGNLASDTTASFTIRAYGATSTAFADRAFTLTGTTAGIKKIETSNSYSLILTTDGSVYSVGTSTVGSLGNGAATSYAVPTKIATLSNIVDIACTSSQQSNAAVDSSGVLWCWGENSASSTTGTNTAVGTNITSPIQNTFLSGVTKLFGGENTIWAITNTGAVYMWCGSYNWVADSGTRMTVPAQKTGLPTNVASISCSGGVGVCCALTTTGDTWTFSDTNSANVWKNAWMGTGVTSNFNVPTKLSSGVAAVGHANYVLVQLMTNGDVYHNGRFANNTYITYPVKNVEASGQGVVEIFGGYGSAYFMRTAAGALYYADYAKDNDWLDNTTLIIGSFVAIASPVPMTKFLTPTRRTTTGMLQGTDGKVYAIGSDSWSATDVTTVFSAVPRQVTVISNLLQAGTFNTAATINRSFVTSGDGVSLFVGTDGNVYGAGDNSGGELTGTATTATNTVIQVPGLSNIVRLSEGYSRRPNFAKDKAGNWWAWARFNSGSLGNGSTTSGVQAPAAWNFVANTDRIVSSDLSVFAKTTDNRWFRWGGNAYGELGLGNTTATGTPTEFTALSNIANVYSNAGGTFYVHLRDGSLYGMGQYARTSTVTQGNPDVTAPTLITTGVAVVYAASFNCSIIRKTDGTIWCWGFNTTGQLGLGNTTAVYADAMVRNTALEALSFRSVSTNGQSVLVLMNDGTVYAMGNRAAFQNATGNYTTPTILSGLSGIQYADVDSSATFVNSSNQVYTSGGNASFQTGFNSGTARDPTLLSTSFTLAAYSSEDVPIWMTSADLSGAALNAAYSKQLTATFGFSFSLVSGSLPTGLSLSSAGLLSGTPTAAGSYGFTVRAFGGSTAAYVDRAFAMDFSVTSEPDVTFEALKTAGRIANVANVYDVSAYSFLPVAGAYEFVVLGQTSTTTLATRMTCSLFTLGSYNQYDALPRDAALNGSTMPGGTTTTVTANTNYYVRYMFTTNLLTAVLCTGFTPATWTFSGVVSTTTWAISADMGDVSLEALKFSTSGVGTLSGVWSRNTPVLAVSGYQRGISGSGSVKTLLASNGDVYSAGYNLDGRLSGVVGSQNNQYTKVSGLSNVTHFSEGFRNLLQFARDSAGNWWQWGVYAAYELGNGSTSSGVLAPTPFTALSNVTRIVSAGNSGNLAHYARTADGKWYRWGPNTGGALATGNTTSIATPTEFTALPGIRNVAAAGSAVVFHLNDGTLYGAGDFGDGVGARTAPVLLLNGVQRVVGSEQGYFALKADGTWVCAGINNGCLAVGYATAIVATAPVSNPVLNGSLNGFGGVRSITVGNAGLYLKASTVVTGSGSSDNYSSVTATQNSGVAISGLPSTVAFAHHNGNSALFVTWDLKVYTAGNNQFYQTGFNSGQPRDVTLLPLSFTLAPLSRAPTWNTAAIILAVSAGGVVSQRLDATDARLYRVVFGSLPAGLTLSIDGLITGTASSSGAYAFTVRAYGMTSGSISDRSFAWTVDAQSSDVTFEAYKTAGTIAKVTNAYNLGSYSFLPTSGTYDFVVTDRSTTTTPGAAFNFSLFTGGTSPTGAFSTYVMNPLTVQLLLHGDGSSIVDSAAGRTLTNGGGVSLSTTQSKFGGKSLSFDGTASSVLTVAGGGVFGSGDFTVEAFVYMTDVTNYLGLYHSGSHTTAGSCTVYVNNGQQFVAFVDGSSTGLNYSLPVGKYNKWTHLAVVRSSGTVTMYVDGASVLSSVRTGAVTQPGFTVGYCFGAGPVYYMDEHRVSSVAQYTANFTPTTSAFVDPVSATVTANVDYYARLRVEATQMTYTLHTSFTPGTWTFGAPILTQTFAVNASDVSLENMQVTTSGVGTLQNIYSVNTPIVAAFGNQSRIMGIDNANMIVSSSGAVWGAGFNADGRITGTAGANANLYTQLSSPINIVRLAEGHNTLQFGQDRSGAWWSWGVSRANERGDGTATAAVKTPSLFTGVLNVQKIVGSYASKWAKTTDGKWYRWGLNGDGELATGNTTAMPTPTEYTGLANIRDIYGYRTGFMILTTDGSLYKLGAFSDGGGSATSPVLCATSVSKVFGNGYSVFFLKNDGTWWCGGANNSGQLGIGNTTNNAAPVTAPVSHTGLNSMKVACIAGATSAGNDATLVLRADRSVIAYGFPTAYKGVVGTNQGTGEVLTGIPSNIVSIQYSGEYSCVNYVTADGKLFTAGQNDLSQAGVASPNPKPIGQITTSFPLPAMGQKPTWNTAATLSAFATGTAVSVRLDATDARLYKVVSGSLPTGLSLSVDGLLSGTPTAVAAYSFTVRAFGMTSGAYADRTFAVVSTATQIELLSSATQTACNGCFSIRRISTSYTGPTFKLQRSSDSAQLDFYCSNTATLGSALDGTGTSVSSWLGGGTASVQTWYDQSGKGAHATGGGTMPTLTLSGSTAVNVNFGAASYLSMPNGTVPFGNTPYTMSVTHGAIPASTVSAGFVGSGSPAPNQNNCFRFQSTGYNNYWNSNDLQAGTSVANANAMCRYDGTTRAIYVNGTLAGSDTPGVRASTNLNNTLGKGGGSDYLIGTMVSVYIFGNAAPVSDIAILKTFN